MSRSGNRLRAAVRPRSTLLAVVALMSFSAVANGQFEVSLELDKKNYVEHENIKAKISIQNLAGVDVVLAGPGESGWINFDITEVSVGSKPRPVGVRGALDVPARVLAAGERYTASLTLNRFYPVNEFGTYAVKCTVYYAGAGNFYDSNRVVFQVHDAHTFWEKSVGVPPGYPDAGAIRRYQLLRYRERRKTVLYARIRDEGSQRVHATFPLGDLIEHESPQVTTDFENRMHILFLTAPRIYLHVVINPDGGLESVAQHKDNGGQRPTLTQTNDQTVAVRGGSQIEPNGDASPGDPDSRTPGGFRPASRRPEGF